MKPKQNYCTPKPCAECPFTRGDKAVRLSRSRAIEISANALSHAGGGFPCHKTVGDGKRRSSSRECAGSLILSLKHDVFTQSMRIAERLNLLTPQLASDLLEHSDMVFDSQDEMVETAWENRTCRVKAEVKTKAKAKAKE